MLTFTEAMEVAPGDKITSAQYNKLARAYNDRILSGVADAAWRIVWDMWSGLRLIQNPEDSGGLPVVAAASVQQDIWLRFYGMLKPNGTPPPDWPAAGAPGEAEGLNLNVPIANFVFGIALGDAGLDDETTRLQNVIPSGAPSLEDLWESAKAQRGGIDLAAAQQDAPVLTAAKSHYGIAYRALSTYMKTYGGFFPTQPLSGADCGDAAATPSYEIIFNPLLPNPLNLPQRVFQGYCPQGSSAGTVAAIGYGKEFYYLYGWNGDVYELIEQLRTDQYIEGPYEGAGRLTRGVGKQVDQALNKFVSDWRGSDIERVEPFRVRELGFDFQRFFAQFFHLAPAKGVVDGPGITVEYPEFRFDGAASFPAGALAGKVGGGTTHDIAENFVLSGYFIKAEGLIPGQVVNLELYDEALLQTITLTADETGAAQFMRYFGAPGPGSSGTIRPTLPTDEMRARRNISLRLAGDGLALPGGASIVLQLAETLAYKPTLGDAYVVLRLATTNGSAISLDKHGKYASVLAKQASDFYFNHGTIVNPLASSPPAMESTQLWQNPVYEAARLLNIENIRLATRENLRAYEVIVEDGVEKSVLYYKRHYLLTNTQAADIFENIAPPVGAPADENGIVTEAPVKGRTNEWCAFLSTNVYHPAGDSLWHEGLYDKEVLLHNRCHFYSGELRNARYADLRQHFFYGAQLALIVEAPTGYNYVRNTNAPGNAFTDAQAENRYRSCQIYQAPYRIERCENYTGPGGEAWVKIVFTGRWQHHHELTGAVSMNVGDWDAAAVQAEPYRTDENAIRQYLLHKSADPAPYNCTRGMMGDMAADSDVFATTGQPFGSCYARLYFVRLVPEVHEDDNDVTNPAVDARCLVDAFQQMDKYGRAMCEGYIDTITTEAVGCDFDPEESPLIDYRVENWFFDAIGQKWLPILPVAVRGDTEIGYGPMPVQKMYADTFNAFVKGINLLTRARLELPMKLECLTRTYASTQTITPDWPAGATCVGAGPMKAIWGGTPPGASTLVSESEWLDCGVTLSAGQDARILETCDGSNFVVRTERSEIEHRLRTQDERAILAVPEILRDLIYGNQVGFLVNETKTDLTPCKVTVTTSGETEGCCFAFQEPCPGFFGETVGPNWVGYAFGARNPVTTECVLEAGETVTGPVCKTYKAGFLNSDALGAGDLFLGRQTGDPAAVCNNLNRKSTDWQLVAGTLAPFLEVPLG